MHGYYIPDSGKNEKKDLTNQKYRFQKVMKCKLKHLVPQVQITNNLIASCSEMKGSFFSDYTNQYSGTRVTACVNLLSC